MHSQLPLIHDPVAIAALPAVPPDTRLYIVELRGAPEMFAARRTALQEQFRAAMNERLGGEAHAATALHALNDGGELEEGPHWHVVEPEVMATMAALLPPGAHFLCSLNWSRVFGQSAKPPYEVALVDAGGLSTGQRIAAETRFADAIERAQAGPDEVAQTYKAWQALSECSPEELNPATVQLGNRWPRAADVANKAGFDKLGEFAGAYFEVRLLRG